MNTNAIAPIEIDSDGNIRAFAYVLMDAVAVLGSVKLVNLASAPEGVTFMDLFNSMSQLKQFLRVVPERWTPKALYITNEKDDISFNLVLRNGPGVADFLVEGVNSGRLQTDERQKASVLALANVLRKVEDGYQAT